jgi:hypothetical protein
MTCESCFPNVSQVRGPRVCADGHGRHVPPGRRAAVLRIRASAGGSAQRLAESGFRRAAKRPSEIVSPHGYVNAAPASSYCVLRDPSSAQHSPARGAV